MGLMLESLDLLGTRPAPQDGEPMRLPVDAIDEDPGQPRFEFDEEALHELAATIRERGVRQPISVRPSPAAEGRWLLNFGARRLRASKLAGRTDIPAFIDVSADSYDQVIENEQREGLKPLELALFVQKRLALGDRQADIAKNLGKSRQWVTLATALIDAPEWLLQAYREGRCRGMNELYELRRLHGEHAIAVQAWAADEQAITRDRIAELRAALASNAHLTSSGEALVSSESRRLSMPPIDRCAASARGLAASPPPLAQHASKLIHVEFDGQEYQLVVSVAPDQPGHVYVRPLVGGPRRLAPASALKLLGFVGG
jgi:ParB family chromosome partitioning protein